MNANVNKMPIQHSPTPKRSATEPLITLSDDDEDSVRNKIKRTRASPPNCAMCKLPCEVTEVITCQTCLKDLHLKCINMSETFHKFFILQKNAPWHCFTCQSKQAEESSARIKQFDAIVTKIDSKYEAMQEEMYNQAQKIDSNRQQTNIMMETFIKNNELTDKKISSLSEKLHQQEQNLAKELCYLQGSQRQNEIVITGIPQSEGENIMSFIVKIGAALNTTITPASILKCHRLGRQSTQSLEEKNQPILVKFNNQATKDNLESNYISSLKTRKYLMTSQIGISSKNERIYINAHLPQCLTKVYKRAMELRKTNVLEAVNARSNCIHIKFNQISYKIQTLEQLEDLIERS